MEKVTLSNGVEMPVIGFGVYQIPPAETARCVRDALEVGYRHIDTAQAYANEAEVGQAVAESGLAREDVFLTTKVWIDRYGDKRAYASVCESLTKLLTDYIDLVLLHQPFADCYGSWRALEKLYAEGKIRAIGVSNFGPGRLADLGAFNDVAPMVNQIETNPLHQQVAAHDAMTQRGVCHEAWAPFGEGRQGMFANPVLAEIAAAHGKSVAQVIVRWLVQRDIVVLAKSTHRERMAENLDVFDFALTGDDMARIAALDEGASLFLDHDAPETVDLFLGFIGQRRD